MGWVIPLRVQIRAIKEGSSLDQGTRHGDLCSVLSSITSRLKDKPHNLLPYFISATSEVKILKFSHRELLSVVGVCSECLGI